MNFTLLSTTSATEVLPTLRAGGLPVSNVSDGGGGGERCHQVSAVTLQLEASWRPQPSRLRSFYYVAMLGNNNHSNSPLQFVKFLKATLECLVTVFYEREVVF